MPACIKPGSPSLGGVFSIVIGGPPATLFMTNPLSLPTDMLAFPNFAKIA
jgi:hypothetical protein